VSYEDLFKRLSDYHIRIGHGGVGKMHAILSNKYSISRPAIETFLSICTICNTKKGSNRKLVIKPIVSNNFNEIGQVDLVNF
jgi:hypothetical protein